MHELWLWAPTMLSISHIVRSVVHECSEPLQVSPSAATASSKHDLSNPAASKACTRMRARGSLYPCVDAGRKWGHNKARVEC